MKRAIVLSGGGSKGAYEMGVWKALRELNIKYDIVTGTSVGALNGALMVQGNFYKGLNLWRRLSFKLLFDEKETDFKSVKSTKDIYKIYAKNIILSGGLNPKELENTLRVVINESKVRKSKIDYGMITVKVPSFKGKCLTKKDIPQGKLVDYLMASATCFPAFQMKKIGGSAFIDGGFYDNMPINLAIDMGATEIIAVDLEAVGAKKPPKKDMKITYISPNNDLGSFLIFDSKIARRNIKYGYNDTLKALGKLEGKKYTFKKGHLELNFNKNKNKFIEIAKQIYDLEQKEPKILDKLISNTTIKRIALGTDKELMKVFNRQAEYLGKVFEINDTSIYSWRRYNALLFKELHQVESLDLKLIETKIKKNQFKDLLHTKIIVKYIYEKLNHDTLTKKEIRNLTKISHFFPKDFLGALYLNSISQSWF